VAEAVATKQPKLSSGIYDPCDAYELLVYDNTPTMGLDYHVAISLLRTKVARPFGFRRITVLDDRQVLYDVLGSRTE